MLGRFALILLLFSTASAHAATSNSLLDVSPDGSRLLVANTDSGSVSIVDLKERKLLHEIPVGDTPEGVSWAGSNLAIATLWGEDKLAFIDTAAGKVIDTLVVPDEPYGIVVTKDGKRAYVTHDYPGAVSEIDIASRKVLRTIPAGQAIRGIAVSADEKTLYVTEFFTARLLAIDLAAGRVVDTWGEVSAENLCRNVVLHPSWPKAYLPHIKSRIVGFDARGSIFSHLAVCDLVPRKDPKESKDSRRRTHSSDAFNGVIVVGNPWEVAISPDGSRLYEIHAGTDELNVFTPLDDSYRDAKGTGRPSQLRGKHPRAIRTSPDGNEVYVYHTLDFAVAVYDKEIERKLATIPVCTPPHTAEWRRGKELFVSAKQPMGSQKWISCSSCHPDGLGDGRVWQNPEGNRRTTALFGLAHTHPIHWSADRDEVQDFEYTVRGPLMRGRGLFEGRIKPREGFLPASELDMDLAGKSSDLDALAVYTNSFQCRPSPHAPGGKLTPEAARGKALFFAESVGCAKCHSGPYFTDSSLTRPYTLHDVGTGDDPREKMGPKYDTPTLIGVYRMGPYLHDGRAKTLHEVLTTFNKGDRHGTTSHLKPNDIDDLVAFLKSLPYEPLPNETPNAVKHRLHRDPK